MKNSSQHEDGDRKEKSEGNEYGAGKIFIVYLYSI